MRSRNDAASGAGSEGPIGTVFIVPADGRRFSAELLALTPTAITLRVSGQLLLFGEHFIAELEQQRSLYVVAKCELMKDFRWRVEGSFQRTVLEGEKPQPIEPQRDAPPAETLRPPEDVAEQS